MRRTILIGLLVVGVFVLGVGTTAGVAYVLWPHSGQATRMGARRARAEAPDPARGATKGPGPQAGRGAGAKSKAPRPGGSRAFPTEADDLTPDERLQYRRSYRDERLSDVDRRLDAHAAAAGWTPERTEAIRELLIDTTDGITVYMEQIDRGETTWEEQKEAVRTYRYEQAAKIEAVLGDEFEAFVEGMRFTRFLGEANAPDPATP